MSTTQPHTLEPPPIPKRVGDLLLEQGLVTDQQIKQAIDYQRDRNDRRLLGEVLIELGFVDSAQVLQVVTEAAGQIFCRLNSRLMDPAVIETLDREFCETAMVLPLFLVDGKLTVAISDPDNVFISDEIQRLCGHPVQLVIVPPKDLQTVIGSAYTRGDDVFVLDEVMATMDEPSVSVVESEIADLSDAVGASDSPVIKLANYIIYAAVREQASDIHIEPDEARLRVRYRVDGRLYEKMAPPHRLHPALTSRLKIMAGLDISERRLPQDGAITVAIDRRQIDLRVSTMPGKAGEKVVMRIADQKNAITQLEKLGFEPDMLAQLRDLIAQPNGVVLVTGPTGSGKTTTLYGALSEINGDDVNISTVEDPVEYNITGVNQFQVHEKAGFTFPSALRSLLRQDPDVVMLGEIRDEETARIAMQAALTGHLVLSTLHTNDAIAAVTRLSNIGIEPYLIAAAIRGVLAQRLVRKLCRFCKEPVPIKDLDVSPAASVLLESNHGLTEAHKTVGCSKCRDTGYSGRVGVYELYAPDDAALEAMSHGAGMHDLRKLALATPKTYTTLRQDGINKIRQGLTTFDELIRATAG